MAKRGKCQWNYDDRGKTCGEDALDTIILCEKHLKEQKRAIEVCNRNAELVKSVECTGLNVLEEKTEKIKKSGGTPLDVIEGDPAMSYKNARYTNRKINENQLKGWKLVRVEAPDSAQRPVCGQDQDVRERYKDQVNEKGYIQLGDTVLMERPKKMHQEQITASVGESKLRAEPIFETGGSAALNRRHQLPPGLKFAGGEVSGRRSSIEVDQPVNGGVSTNKRTYQVPSNYQVKG